MNELAPRRGRQESFPVRQTGVFTDRDMDNRYGPSVGDDCVRIIHFIPGQLKFQPGDGLGNCIKEGVIKIGLMFVDSGDDNRVASGFRPVAQMRRVHKHNARDVSRKVAH